MEIGTAISPIVSLMDRKRTIIETTERIMDRIIATETGANPEEMTEKTARILSRRTRIASPSRLGMIPIEM
jgi:hypothetical protein